MDRSILAVLEKHGRISNADLAAQVGLSPSPCLRRVRRLEETGVIRGYQALVDPAALGRGLRVFAGVRLMRHARADVVAIMDALGIAKAHIVGHSMGAYTALHVGIRHP